MIGPSLDSNDNTTITIVPIGISAHAKNMVDSTTPIRDAQSTATLVELDHRLRRALVAYFARRVSSITEAEDLTQDVFERVLKSMQSGPVLNGEALVFRIAVNLVRDRARRRRTRGEEEPLHGDGIAEIADALAVGLSPERVVMGERSLEEVHLVLNELNERTRAMFYLYRLENLKVREIAELYGISASAVEKQLSKALLHLTQRFHSD